MATSHPVIPPWRRNVEDIEDVVSIFVETLGHTVDDDMIFDNILKRVRERGTILNRILSDDDVYFRMATETQADRVVARTSRV